MTDLWTIPGSEKDVKLFDPRIRHGYRMPVTTELGIRFWGAEIDGEVHLFMDIPSRTSTKALRAAVPLAQEWSNQLLGPDSNTDVRMYLLREIALLEHAEGKKPSVIAKETNQEILKHIKAWHILKDFPEISEMQKLDIDFLAAYMRENGADPYAAIAEALTILNAWIEDITTIAAIIQAERKAIREGNTTFSARFPIDAMKVITRLKYWRHKSSARERLLKFRERGG